MIEVLMPFLLMKQAPNPSTQDTVAFDSGYVYAYFKRFVQLYIPNTLHTKFNGRGGTSLPYLKCALILAEMLL